MSAGLHGGKCHMAGSRHSSSSLFISLFVLVRPCSFARPYISPATKALVVVIAALAVIGVRAGDRAKGRAVKESGRRSANSAGAFQSADDDEVWV